MKFEKSIVNVRLNAFPVKKSVKTSKNLLREWLIALDEILDVYSSCF